MYLSGHPLDDYSDTRHEFDFDTSMLFVESADEDGNTETVIDQSLAGKTVKFGCVVSSFEKKATAKQQKFAVGRVEDRMGSISFSMYPRAYEKYGDLLSADCPLKIVGKIDLRDESEAKISIEKVEIWQQDGAMEKTSAPVQNAPKSNGILYVLIQSGVEKDMVSDILALHPGNTPCQAQVKRDGQSKLLEFAQKSTYAKTFLQDCRTFSAQAESNTSSRINKIFIHTKRSSLWQRTPARSKSGGAYQRRRRKRYERMRACMREIRSRSRL